VGESAGSAEVKASQREAGRAKRRAGRRGVMATGWRTYPGRSLAGA
jgi:hypothetical protein